MRTLFGPAGLLVPAVLTFAAAFVACSEAPPPPPPAEAQRLEVQIPRADGSQQPAFVILPAGFDPQGEKRPLVVSLHSWSGDYTQRQKELEEGTVERGWIYLFPDFRGANDDPDACGSEAAQQDILDAAAWAQREYPVDPDRVYLTGGSGGGHMTLLMAARHPEPWKAASAWVPISDLVAWYGKHAEERYGEMMRACTGGAPGDSPDVDEEYRKRSPLTWLAEAAPKLPPLDIAAGVRDGHEGSVPIRHSLEAFNAIAKAVGGEPVTEEEIAELSAGPEARLASPKPSDQVEDAAFGRAIYLRREAGPARVTIFEGGHEAIAAGQLDWLARHP
ncbi:MAG: prolyl oligopeptidase family serine peptidase [Acidobacteria bacterium]|nr:prolyl oligopeptidase family serine peptidase [Acidobacteriota bacterium]